MWVLNLPMKTGHNMGTSSHLFCEGLNGMIREKIVPTHFSKLTD